MKRIEPYTKHPGTMADLEAFRKKLTNESKLKEKIYDSLQDCSSLLEKIAYIQLNNHKSHILQDGGSVVDVGEFRNKCKKFAFIYYTNPTEEVVANIKNLRDTMSVILMVIKEIFPVEIPDRTVVSKATFDNWMRNGYMKYLSQYY